MNDTTWLSALALVLALAAAPARAQDDAISRALQQADDLAEQGRFREALARLERDAAALEKGDPEGWAEHGPKTIALYRKLLPAEQRFEDACAAARKGQKEALVAWVREVEGGTYEHVGYAFVDPWRIRARDLLGDAAYRKIIQDLEAEAVQKLQLDDVLQREGDELDLPKRPEIQTRRDPARRERLRVAARSQQAQLGQMRVVLGAAENLRRGREQRAQERAVGREVEGARVERWDARGFALAKDGQVQAWGWDDADPALAVKVRALGVAADDGLGLHDLGLFALERGCFDEGEAFLAQAAALDPTWARKDLDLARLRRLARPFQGDLTFERDPLIAVSWPFDRAEEERDLAVMSRARAEVANGALKITSDGDGPCLLRVRGQWHSAVEVEARRAGPGATLLLALSCPGARLLVEVDGATARVLELGRRGFAQVKTAPASSPPTAPVRLTGAFDGRRLHVRLDLDGKQALTHSLDWTDPTEVQVGARRGEVRLDALTVRGAPRAGSLDDALGAGVGEVVRALMKAEDDRRPRGLPSGYWETSAEDALGLADVTSAAVTLVAEGRDQLLLGGGLPKAARKFVLAADRAPTFAAAVLLEGRARLDAGDLHNALERAETAIALIEDFHEALVLRGAVLLRLARLDEAERTLEQAARLAPASPALWRARSDLLRARGDLAGARDACSMACVLAVEDPEAAIALQHLDAIVAGPAVLHRSTHGDLTLVTDLPEAERAALVPAVEAAAKLPALLAERFPALARAGAARPHRLVVLRTPGAFHRWLTRRGLVTGPEVYTHVDPVAGDVVVRWDPDRAVPWLRRCLVLTWLDEQALGLPRWAREAIAGVVADEGAAADARGTTPLRHRLKTLALGWPRRPRLFDVATGSEPAAAEEALPGLAASLAWALVRLCSDPQATGKVDDEEVPLGATFAEYLGLVAAPVEGSARLEHAWVQTFHRLEPDDLDAKLRALLERLAAEQGVAWPKDAAR